MRVIYYRKERKSLITPTFSFEEHCFYLPEKGMLLYKHYKTALGKADYVSTTDAKKLEEAKGVLEGKLKDDMSISKAKEFDYSSKDFSYNIQCLVLGVCGEPDLKASIEELIKKARKK